MFTGIITDIGNIIDTKKASDDIYSIKTIYNLSQIEIGSSVACSGMCLTVISKKDDYFDVQISSHSLEKTNSKYWQIGTKINLERSLTLGSELNGHMVTGHVDTTGKIVEIESIKGSYRFKIEIPEEYSKFIAEKGSVTVDGVSLTVNKSHNNSFEVNIIPHTFEKTTFQYYNLGYEVNIEIDILCRYIARLIDKI